MLPILFMLAVMASPATTELVLRAGGSITIGELVAIQGDRVLYRDSAGTLYSISIDEVDLEATTDPHRASTAPSRKRSGTSASSPIRALRVSPPEKARLLDQLEKTAGPGSPPPVNPVRDSNGDSEPSADDETPAEGEEDEWRAKAKALSQQIESARTGLEDARRREHELSDFLLFVAGSSGNADGYSNYVFELESVRARIRDLERELDRAERDLREFSDLARRRGVPPGWLR